MRQPARNSHGATVCLCVLAAVLVLAGCGGDRSLAPLPADAVVLAFGDSITAGVGAGPGQDYPTALAAATGWQVVNAGISGDTARQARSRLAAVLATTRPDLVILELGGNDFLRRTPAARVRDYLREIVREARAAGTQVALVAVPRLSLIRASAGILSDSPIYAEIAAEEGVILIPDILSEILSNGNLRADQIHPNAAGYRQLAAGIKMALAGSGLVGD